VGGVRGFRFSGARRREGDGQVRLEGARSAVELEEVSEVLASVLAVLSGMSTVVVLVPVELESVSRLVVGSACGGVRWGVQARGVRRMGRTWERGRGDMARGQFSMQ